MSYCESEERMWRIYLADDGPKVICAQWFDIYDYDEKRFLYGTESECNAFWTETEAQKFLDTQTPSDEIVFLQRVLYTIMGLIDHQVRPDKWYLPVLDEVKTKLNASRKNS